MTIVATIAIIYFGTAGFYGLDQIASAAFGKAGERGTAADQEMSAGRIAGSQPLAGCMGMNAKLAQGFIKIRADKAARNTLRARALLMGKPGGALLLEIAKRGIL